MIHKKLIKRETLTAVSKSLLWFILHKKFRALQITLPFNRDGIQNYIFINFLEGLQNIP